MQTEPRYMASIRTLTLAWFTSGTASGTVFRTGTASGAGTDPHPVHG